MKINERQRQQKRKRMAQYEVEKMCLRYWIECGECQTREMTEEEKEKYSKYKRGE